MKKSFMFLVFAALLAFASFSVAQTDVQSGTWSVNPGNPGYSLDKNNGERTVTMDISFSKGFETKPNVILSVTQIDSEKDANQRYNVEAISISRDGFTLKVRTWADSKVFSLSGFWMAHAD